MKLDTNRQKEEDQYFVNQIRQKDMLTFELLYKKHYSKLYVLSNQYVCSQEVAEEIVHDVFVRIWEAAERIKIEESLERYLARSVVNACLNHLNNEKKSKIKREQYLQTRSDVRDEGSVDEEPEQLFIKLEQALESLPPQCRKVMMLSRFEKLKQKNIAEQMGISIKTVKNHLTYGFNKMRGIMGDKSTTGDNINEKPSN